MAVSSVGCPDSRRGLGLTSRAAWWRHQHSDWVSVILRRRLWHAAGQLRSGVPGCTGRCPDIGCAIWRKGRCVLRCPRRNKIPHTLFFSPLYIEPWVSKNGVSHPCWVGGQTTTVRPATMAGFALEAVEASCATSSEEGAPHCVASRSLISHRGPVLGLHQMRLEKGTVRSVPWGT